MNTIQLESLLSRHECTRDAYVGVFAIDRLPSEILHFPALFIVNTDCANKPGSHWVCIYIASPEWGYFFDSYGFEPSFWDFRLVQFLSSQTNCGTFSWNSKTLQTLQSDTCGEWCILAADHLCRWRPENHSEVTPFPPFTEHELCHWVDVHFSDDNKFGLIVKDCKNLQACSCMKNNLSEFLSFL